MYDRAQLAALSAVVDSGSFEAAARELHLTPSAVSQRVRSLENVAGAVLVRRTRPCVATSAGEHLVRLARPGRRPRGRHRGGAAPARRPGDACSIAANADSVSTWFVEALRVAGAVAGTAYDVRVDDENHTAALLRAGAVMGAVTTAGDAVQGCRSVPIGALRYRAVAAPGLGHHRHPQPGRRPAGEVPRHRRDPRPAGGPGDERALTGTVHTVSAGDGYLARSGPGSGGARSPSCSPPSTSRAAHWSRSPAGGTWTSPCTGSTGGSPSAPLATLTDAVVATARTHLVRRVDAEHGPRRAGSHPRRDPWSRAGTRPSGLI